MTLGEVLARVSNRRRDNLKRVLAPARYEAILAGLAERRWVSTEQARRELGVSRAAMQSIRTALRISGLMPWGGQWEAFSLDAKSPVQQRLFTVKDSGYKYQR